MFIEIDQAPIYLEKQGEGEPALLLHGVPDSGDMWQDLVTQIKHQFTCYTTDLPGIHRSGIPKNFQFELRHYGEYVNQLVESSGINTPVTLIAHDWGGIYAMSFACQYPDKVKRFIGGSFPFSHLYHWHPWAAAWRTPIFGELSMLVMNQWVFRWELHRGGALLTDQQIDETYEGKVDCLAPRKTILKMYRSATPSRFLPFQNSLERLSKQCEIHLIWGAKDKYVPTHMADMMHPTSKRILSDCGHWVPLEATNELAKLVLSAAGFENGVDDSDSNSDMAEQSIVGDDGVDSAEGDLELESSADALNARDEKKPSRKQTSSKGEVA